MTLFTTKIESAKCLFENDVITLFEAIKERLNVKQSPPDDQMETVLHLFGKTVLFYANGSRAYPRPLLLRRPR
ncbi:hypothetical protein A9P44_18975 [Paenibacillus polymyxa]|nr:hypothetical protein A9P44_18975 [Paenibacillus polymyxa]